MKTENQITDASAATTAQTEDEAKTQIDEGANIAGAYVSIEWGGSGNILGRATHSVSEAALDEGSAEGPSDGERFTLRGVEYRLGQHDYETDDGTVTCSAAIYFAD